MYSKSGPYNLSLPKPLDKINFDANNLHNPAVQQRSGLLLAAYVVPPEIEALHSIMDPSTRLFWPSPLMDELRTVLYGEPSSKSSPGNNNLDKSRQWIIGKRKEIFVAVSCTHTIKYDDSPPPNPKEDEVTFQDKDDAGNARSTLIPRLVCSFNEGHSWIVVVGTTDDYSSIDEFIDTRLQLITVEEKEKPKPATSFLTSAKGSYEITVHDGTSVLTYEKSM